MSFPRPITKNLLETKILSYVERIKASPDEKEKLVAEFEQHIAELDAKIPKKISEEITDELLRVLKTGDRPDVLQIIKDLPRQIRRTQTD